MKEILENLESTERRFNKRANIINPIINSILKSKGLKNWPDTIEKVNSKTTLNKRFKYLNKKFPAHLDITKERVLGKSDLVHINYMEKGLEAARSVGRVVVKDNLDRIKGHGSGFLVSPNLFLTNNHVIESKEEAAYSDIEFNYEYDINGRIEPYYVFKLKPEVFYLSSPFEDLDFTLVAVEAHDIYGRKDLSDFGFLPLIQETGKAALGENLTIIQHPRGEVKQIAMRENDLIDKDERYLRYMTDTDRGSSGSAVLNDQWEVVALHHSAIPRRDSQGNILKKDGSIWVQSIDRDIDIDWIANEGIRISRIVNDVKGQLVSETGGESSMASMFRSF